MTVFLLKYWKQLAAVFALVLGCMFVYKFIYDIGYKAAEIHYTEKIKAYEDKVDQRIQQIQSGSTVLIEQVLLNRQATKQELTKVLLAVKDKPLYRIDTTGKCQLSEDFIAAYNAGIDKVNKK